MSIDDYTKPVDTGKPDSTSHTANIDKALTQAEGGDFAGVTDTAFLDRVRAVRVQDEKYYLQFIKPRIKALKACPIGLGDLDKLTKPPKAKSRYSEQAGESDNKQPRQGKTELLIGLIRQNAHVFCDDSGRAFASFMVSPVNRDTGEVLPAHQQTWALESQPFRAYFNRDFLARFGVTAGETAIKEAVEILTADAADGKPEPVYLRYAPIPERGGVYVDLCNEGWEVVEVTPVGWRVIPATGCKVRFRRTKNAKPLPMPEPGGTVSDLWQHLNISNPDQQLLVVAWLLEAMRTDTPYPVLELVAEQGSAKSTTQNRLRALVDPNAVMLRQEPRSITDLSVSAISSHIISLNNLSHLTTAQQDFMCNMATGGGDATRKLFTTEDESAWDTKRPVVMNGINQLVTRPDLADRTVCVELPKISQYVDERTLQAAWENAYPKLVGALYGLLSGALRELPAVDKAGLKLPRMGDFAKLGVAMVRAMGGQVDFLAVFNRNRDEVVRRGVDSSPVAAAILNLARDVKSWEGTAGELMLELDRDLYRPRYYDKAAWPKSARGLGELLRRLAPSLRVCGVEIEKMTRSNAGERYRLRWIDPTTDTIATVL